MKTFEEAAAIEFPDLSTTISKAQIQQVYDKYKTKWPSHIASKENRISRGIYSYTQNQTEEIALQKVIERSIEVPEIDPAYVPFGFFKDLTNIIKSNKFYPVLISGHHGSGKTKMVEQVCAQLKRPLIRVNISIDTDETDLIGGPSLENGNIIFKDGPILTAMKTGSILACLEKSEKIKVGTLNNSIDTRLYDMEIGKEYPVISYNLKTSEFENDIGVILAESEKDNLYIIEFEDGTTITMTDDHPVIIEGNQELSILDGLSIGDMVISL